MQRRIARLIITDFLCWVPITTMAFMHFSEIVNLDGIVYVISAIVLLPINSVLNPILYSEYFDDFFMKILSAIPKCNNSSEQPQEAMEMNQMSTQEQNLDENQSHNR